MAKKSSGENISVKLQELANSAQIQIQKLANEATEKSFKYNSAEAATNRQWQTEMSNTSHQREVADLKKAGLNPVLSANQGAMSYTSASASAQANDPSGAVGSLLGNQMNNVAQIGMTKMNNAAQLKAAGAQAAAMKAAAAASASAAKYAADRQFAASVYHSDQALKASKYNAKMQYKTAIDRPATGVSALVDKYLQKTGFSSTLVNSNFVKGVKNAASKLVNDPKAYFKDVGTTIKMGNFKLNSAGSKLAGSSLTRMGLANTSSNQKLFIQAFVFGSNSAMVRLAAQRRSRY